MCSHCCQLLFGLLIGAVLGLLIAYFMRRFRVEVNGLYSLFIMAIAILAYTLAERMGGNGYLSVYIAGILLGNSKMLHKRNLVHFFDGISLLSQIILFFAIDLLSFPSRFISILAPGILVFLFLLLVARPIATALLLTPFRVPFRSQAFVSWVWRRGAAPIVFAIYAVSEGVPLKTDIFHICLHRRASVSRRAGQPAPAARAQAGSCRRRHTGSQNLYRLSVGVRRKSAGI